MDEALSGAARTRGIEQGLPLTIADGYHRVCASYYTSDDANIPARLVDLTVPSKLLSKK